MMCVCTCKSQTELVMMMMMMMMLSRSDHVIDVDVIVIVELDKVYGGFGLNLLDDRSHSLRSLFVLTLHLLPDQRFADFSRLPGLNRILCRRETRSKPLITSQIIHKLKLVKNIKYVTVTDTVVFFMERDFKCIEIKTTYFI